MFSKAIRFAGKIFIASNILSSAYVMADSTPNPSVEATIDVQQKGNMMRQESINSVPNNAADVKAVPPVEEREVFAIKEMSARSAKTAARLFCTRPKASEPYADGLRFFGNYPVKGIDMDEKYAVASRKNCAESLLPSAVALYLKSKIPVHVSFAKAMQDSKSCDAKVMKKGYRSEAKLLPWAKSIASGKKGKSCLAKLSSESEFLMCVNSVTKKSEQLKPEMVSELKNEFSLNECTADAQSLRLEDPFVIPEIK